MAEENFVQFGSLIISIIILIILIILVVLVCCNYNSANQTIVKNPQAEAAAALAAAAYYYKNKNNFIGVVNQTAYCTGSGGPEKTGDVCGRSEGWGHITTAKCKVADVIYEHPGGPNTTQKKAYCSSCCW